MAHNPSYPRYSDDPTKSAFLRGLALSEAGHTVPIFATADKIVAKRVAIYVEWADRVITE